MPTKLDQIFRLVEDRVEQVLATSLFEAAVHRPRGTDANKVIRQAEADAASWLERVRARCRSIARQAGCISPDAYTKILLARMLFGDLPKSRRPRRGRKPTRPPLEPREALRRYTEIFAARCAGGAIERLAQEWAPGAMSQKELIALDNESPSMVAAQLAGAPFQISANEMLKKRVPAAREVRYRAAAELVSNRREDLLSRGKHEAPLSRDEYDEASVGNDAVGDWTKRRGRWLFRPWVVDAAGGQDLGKPVRVKGPGQMPDDSDRN